MKQKLLTLFSLFGLALSSALIPGVAHADEGAAENGIQIAPLSERLTFNPGDKVTRTITVTNQSDNEVAINVYIAPYSVSGESYNSSFSNETPRTQISRWTTFAPEDNTVVENGKSKYFFAPKEKKEIQYTVTVPDDVAGGGQYAAIFAESVPNPSAASGGSSITAVYRLGIFVYANVGGVTRDGAEIVSFSFPAIHLGKENRLINADMRIKNSGNTDFQAVQTLTVKNLFGTVLWQGDKTQDIFPDTEFYNELKWEETPTVGIFKVDYSIRAADKTELITKIVIVIPIFIIIIMLLLLTLIILWLIIVFKRRRDLTTKLKKK